MNVVKNVIESKIYATVYEKANPTYKAIYESLDINFTESQINDIVDNSPQDHKEAGFDKGWPSRFDTWYKLPMEFGFLYYEMNQPIIISDIGKMLINAVTQETPDQQMIQNVFLNSMMKYQRKNPFRKVLNDNIPLILLLQVIKKLKADNPDSAGIFRQELSFFICWPNNDANKLFEYIKTFRASHKFSQYTDEVVYDACLKLLGADESDKKYYKMKQITGEAIDEYIRKMRMTGILSLRGNGRFLDYNTFEIDKINYVLANYSTYTLFADKKQYFNYIGTKDATVLTIAKSVDAAVEDDIRKAALHKYAKEYNKTAIFDELRNVCGKKESKDQMLKFMSAPARFEFLTSIALVQNFTDLDVCPNYVIDDEGLPTSHASGGMADIVCKEKDNIEALVEVTLMCGRQQLHQEMIPINRHLSDVKQSSPDAFAIFIAPSIHADAQEYAEYTAFKKKNIITPYNINEFIHTIDINSNIRDLAVPA